MPKYLSFSEYKARQHFRLKRPKAMSPCVPLCPKRKGPAFCRRHRLPFELHIHPSLACCLRRCREAGKPKFYPRKRNRAFLFSFHKRRDLYLSRSLATSRQIWLLSHKARRRNLPYLRVLYEVFETDRQVFRAYRVYSIKTPPLERFFIKTVPLFCRFGQHQSFLLPVPSEDPAWS